MEKTAQEDILNYSTRTFKKVFDYIICSAGLETLFHETAQVQVQTLRLTFIATDNIVQLAPFSVYFLWAPAYGLWKREKNAGFQ